MFKINNRDTRTNVLVPLLLILTTFRMLTIFTFCFRVLTTNFGQVNASSYFNASIHRRSQQNMLLLNVNQINQTDFFQTYLHHSLPQWYPQNFHMIHLCTHQNATIHLKPCFRYEHKFIRHLSFEVNLHLQQTNFRTDSGASCMSILIGFNTLLTNVHSQVLSNAA